MICRRVFLRPDLDFLLHGTHAMKHLVSSIMESIRTSHLFFGLAAFYVLFAFIVFLDAISLKAAVIISLSQISGMFILEGLYSMSEERAHSANMEEENAEDEQLTT